MRRFDKLLSLSRTLAEVKDGLAEMGEDDLVCEAGRLLRAMSTRGGAILIEDEGEGE